MTNREKLRDMAIDELLKVINNRADEINECIMTLLPGGRLLCPPCDDCDECMKEWLNEET